MNNLMLLEEQIISDIVCYRDNIPLLIFTRNYSIKCEMKK